MKIPPELFYSNTWCASQQDQITALPWSSSWQVHHWCSEKTKSQVRELRHSYVQVITDLTHDGRHVGFAIIMQISYKLLRGGGGQTTQVREIMTNILATRVICFKVIEYVSSK